MINFPKSTEVNRIIPKQKFYENSDITKALKSSFVDDIEKIIWTNKLAPSTLNITESEYFKEIEVFNIKLKNLAFNPKILDTIDKAIPYYIMFIMEYQGRYQIWLGYKEKNNNSDKKLSIVKYFHSEWTDNPEIEVRGNKLDTVYENFLNQVSPEKIDVSSEGELKNKVNNAIEIEALEKKIAQLTQKMNSEKQFNRQCAIHSEIKLLKAKLEEKL